MFEEILRGFACETSGAQNGYYFENTVENVSNFIFEFLKQNKEVLIMDLFGGTVMRIAADGEIIECRSGKCQNNVTDYLRRLQSGLVEPAKVEYLDMKDLNSTDELDSKDVVDKEYERLL